MPWSHHDRLENTLIAYFEQMLADDEGDESPRVNAADEIAQAQPHLSSAQDAILSELDVLQEQASLEEQEYFEPQRQPQEEPALEQRHFADPPSLASLLEAVPQSEVETQTLTKEKEEVAVAQKVEEKTEAVKQEELEVQEEQKVLEQTQTKVQEIAEALPQTEVKEEASELKEDEAAKETLKTAEVKTQEAVPADAPDEDWRALELGDEFQTLFFVAGGVRYAVPLISLGSIFECPKLTRIFSQASWHLGITDIRGEKVSVVDTMQFVNPQAGERSEPYPYIITLGQSRWALTCDVLEGNRTISKDAVKWRQTGGGRPWLAGIVKSERCALIYVDEMIKLLDAGFNESSFNQIAQEDI